MCCKQVCCKVIASVVIVVALALAVAVSVLPPAVLGKIVAVTRFFDVMLPALAVGALLKYILCGGDCGKKDDKDSCAK